MERGFWRDATALLPPEQVARLGRMDQGFRLVSVGVESDEVVILGSAGDLYVISYEDGVLGCSCPDACRNRPPIICKHLCYFLVEEGGGRIAALQGMPAERDRAVAAAMEALRGRMRADADKYCADPRTLRQQDDCCICYERLGEPSGCTRCPVCRNHFHTPCILEWQRRSGACPMCRERSWGDLLHRVPARPADEEFLPVP